MKKTKTILALALICSSLSFSQIAQGPLTFTDFGEESESFGYDNSVQDQKIKTFTEYSFGIMYMPFPLFISEINVTQNGATQELTSGENIFNSGIGLVLNADFRKSGFGPGFFTYYSFVGGDHVRAEDFFGALKWDFPLGDRLSTNFEISPSLGVGNISFIRKDDDAAYGNSFYFSGGARITWRISNSFFFGGDVLLSPMFFNTENLLGVDGDVQEAKIKYKTPVTLNFSLRYNLN